MMMMSHLYERIAVCQIDRLLSKLIYLSVDRQYRSSDGTEQLFEP